MYWNWKFGGILLGIVFVVVIALVKPIGVSTQFVILDGIIANVFNSELVVKNTDNKSGYGSTNAYLDKSEGKYATAVANPLNYSLVFVLCMALGGLFGRMAASPSPDKRIKQIPTFHQQQFGQSRLLRYTLAFLGGVLVLWGARLAGGCTSGHMMSGMMQTAISGYLFSLAAFIFAIPTAVFLYKKRTE